MIHGKRITLRPLKKEDLLLINKWRNNLQNRVVTQGYRGPVTVEVESSWLGKVLNNSDNRNIYFGIEMNKSNGLIGIIQLNEIDYISGVTTCGILIGEQEERNKGIGAEAVRAILFYAFFILNLRKVITYIGDFNVQAFKVQKKAGKVYREGCLKAHYHYKGRYVDLYIQSFFRDDFIHLLDEYTLQQTM